MGKEIIPISSMNEQTREIHERLKIIYEDAIDESLSTVPCDAEFRDKSCQLMNEFGNSYRFRMKPMFSPKPSKVKRELSSLLKKLDGISQEASALLLFTSRKLLVSELKEALVTTLTYKSPPNFREELVIAAVDMFKVFNLKTEKYKGSPLCDYISLIITVQELDFDAYKILQDYYPADSTANQTGAF